MKSFLEWQLLLHGKQFHGQVPWHHYGRARKHTMPFIIVNLIIHFSHFTKTQYMKKSSCHDSRLIWCRKRKAQMNLSQPGWGKIVDVRNQITNKQHRDDWITIRNAEKINWPNLLSQIHFTYVEGIPCMQTKSSGNRQIKVETKLELE